MIQTRVNRKLSVLHHIFLKTSANLMESLTSDGSKTVDRFETVYLYLALYSEAGITSIAQKIILE